MREALARSDHDFVLTAPARARRPVKKTSGGAAQFGAALMRRPGRTLAVVVFAGMLCGVVANALFFQTARHPAPIFRGPVTAARPAHAPVAPPPAAQMTAPNAPIPMPPQRGADKAAATQPTSAPVATRAESTGKDQIGALLSGGASSSSSTSTNSDAARVAAAQKALVKLGYVVKADGVMGSGTRKAIELFEQSRKLPTTGELTPRVTRELSALSGVAVP